MDPLRMPLPSSLVIALGLATNTACGPCLSTDLGVCLSPYYESGDTSTNACLTFSTCLTSVDSGDTDTGITDTSTTDTGTTDTGTTDTGNPAAAAVTEEVLDRGVLPDDLVERLRNMLSGD